MPNKIKITPLAEESLGVRSMCTHIETPDTKILIDPGASLASNRLGYPPHPKEYEALSESRNRINKTAEKTNLITISHYHFDHHTPSYTDWFTNWSTAEIAKQIYKNKIILTKSNRSKVNPSQRRRGWMFKKTITKNVTKLEAADNKIFHFDQTILKFSKPVFHGPENSDLGWLIMTTIETGDEIVLFASDVQGPMYTATLNQILAENPQIVIIGGPPTYLAGFRVSQQDIDTGMHNLRKLTQNVPVTIIEHHILRDEDWKSYIQPIIDDAEKIGHKVLTAAEYLGKENNLLEFKRKQLFETDPPDPDFIAWMNLPLQKRKLTKPPI